MPEQLSTAEPISTTILHSSFPVQRNNVSIQHMWLSSGELRTAPLESHRICMLLTNTIGLEQERNGRTFVHTFQRGQAQLLPLGTSGIWRFRYPVEALNLEFSREFVGSVAEENLSCDPLNVELSDQFLVEDAQIQHIGLALLAEIIEGAPNGILYSNTLATALMVHLLHKYSTAKMINHSASAVLSRSALRRILDYIDSHLADDIGLEELARLANTSLSHFNKLFKQSTGASPYRYIVQKRVQRARHLLLHSDLSIAQIASDVGFYDQSHLTRHMRQLLGVTPGMLQQR